MGKITALITRLIPWTGGSALPGLIALKINPGLINQIREKNNLQSLVITGTNGKTTTSRLLSHILNSTNIPHLHNRSGSNLLRGVASTLINQISLFKGLPYSLAVFELDEAVINQAVKQLKPQIILFTNLFRDQLDRYGEIDTILNQWLDTLKKLPLKTKTILNIDDPSLNYLSQKSKSQTIKYGLSKKDSKRQQLSKSADAIFCPHCHYLLNYTGIFTSHLGHYSCPNCLFKRLNPTVKPIKLQIKLPGIHNQYNLLASYTLAKTLKISSKSIKKALKTFKPAFGRTETFKLGQKITQILLVKNPAGFNVTLETLKAQKNLNQPMLLILNDKIADGTDISWIWDINFNLLIKRRTPIIVSGLRTYDLALRLKYAGIKPSKIIPKKSIKKALKTLKNQSGEKAFILPTYTAMLHLRKILNRQKIIHSTWED